MTRKVLVIGDVMTDIVVIQSGPIRVGTDTPATIRQLPGGSGANQALWLAHQGAEVALAARVGAADHARLRTYFTSYNVTPLLAADDKEPTGQLICLVDPSAERSFLTDRGANRYLGADDLPLSLQNEYAFLHISAYALFEQTPRHAIGKLIETARAESIPVGVDPASGGFLDDVGPAAFLEWTAGSNYIFPNADEARVLTGTSDTQTQLDQLLEHYENVVLKRGTEGAVWARRDRSALIVPARPVQVVDTTGAGDAFVAGFLAMLMSGADERHCLDAGVAAGAIAVASVGAQPHASKR